MNFLNNKRRRGSRSTASILALAGTLFLGGFTNTLAEELPDLEPPQVWIENLKPGQVVSGLFMVQIAASDPQGIDQVSLSRDEGFLDTDSDPPFRIPWDTLKETDGPHTLVARARDLNGNTGVSDILQVTVDNTPPQVQLKEPQHQTVVLGTIRLTAEATDNLGLTSVRFLVDGSPIATVVSPPYTTEWNTKTISNSSHTVEAMAIDQAGNQKISAPLEITVANTNHPPILAPLDPITLKEGETLSLTLQAYDPDGSRDTLTFHATNLPPWARLDPKTGKVEGTPDYKVANLDHPRVFSVIRFEVCDPEPRCSSRDLRLRVVDVNLPPKLLNPTGDMVVREGVPVLFTISDSMDPDEDPIRYTVRGLPRWLHFVQKTRTIKGVPPFDAISQLEPVLKHRVHVRVSDPGKLKDTNTFTITLIDANLPPSFKKLRKRSTAEEKQITFKVHATDQDKTDKLEIKLLSLPDGASFTDHGNRTGTFRWTPQSNQGGVYYLLFVVSDGTLVIQKTLVLKVQETSLSITGQVVDTIGHPFEGARLTLTEAGTEIRVVTTDKNGYYLMKDLRRSNYILRPSYVLEVIRSAEDAQRLRKTYFIPRSRSVKMTGEDQQDVDFVINIPFL